MGERMKGSGDRGQGMREREHEAQCGVRSAESQAHNPLPSTLTLHRSPLTRRRGYVVVDEERCKGCELCIAVCPEGSLQLSPLLNSSAYHPVRMTEGNTCTGCALCAQVCPDVAIEVYRE
jgi:2-oxoglutarate ferredoxin oxidoreductase subunit delta